MSALWVAVNFEELMIQYVHPTKEKMTEVKIKRKAAKVRQVEAAMHLGITQGAYSKMETGFQSMFVPARKFYRFERMIGGRG